MPHSLLTTAHTLVQTVLTAGDGAIDATVGNGHDTLFLARQVGPDGWVVGFDVQEAAIQATQERLRQHGVAERVRLLHEDHARLAEHVDPKRAGTVAAVLFNLGYLPGGSDRGIVTRAGTTLPALAAALHVLRPGGCLSVVVYPGHPGGAREAEAVVRWAAELPARQAQAAQYRLLNRSAQAPWLLHVVKMSAPESDQPGAYAG